MTPPPQAPPFAPEARLVDRPLNFSRSGLHALAGLAVVVASFLVGHTTLAIVATAAAIVGWLLEASRRAWPGLNARIMRIARPFAHAHEAHRVNSSTWYATALAILLVTTPEAPANVGVLAAAFGDPVAGVVGRKLGRRKLRGKKTLEGSLAFLVAATVVGAGYLVAFGVAPFAAALAAAAFAGLVGAIAEVVSTRIDDNLSVPLVAGWAAFLALHLLT